MSAPGVGALVALTYRSAVDDPSRFESPAQSAPISADAKKYQSGETDRDSPWQRARAKIGYDQFHHFISSGVWDAAPIEKALLVEADRMVGGADAW